MNQNHYILTISCPDQPGIVAAVSTFIAAHGGNISCSNQHGEPSTNTFFMRVEIDSAKLNCDLEQFRESFVDIANTFGMQWQVIDNAIKKRVVILASKQSHCLMDLLSRWHSGELYCDIPCIISNHQEAQKYAEWYDIPFHHVPFTAENNDNAFEEIDRIIDEYRADVVVLARFMRIMPAELCDKYYGRMINIHHSFLPAFIGAAPYQKAFDKGVKLIGATCHYVTEDLDEGPIIAQNVVRIDHSHSPDEMRRMGRDVEKTVLASGLRHHLNDEIIIHANKTIVF